MKKTLLTLAILLAVQVFSTRVWSQKHFQVHAGVAIPTGDFFLDPAGNVAAGYNIGVQYAYPITQYGLSIFGGADFFSNALTDESRDELISELNALNTGIVFNLNLYRYYNLPFLAGLQYSLAAGSKLEFIFQAAGGIDILEITDLEIISDGKSSYYQLTSFSSPFAFKLGAGLTIVERFTVSCDFFNLGRHQIKVSSLQDGYILFEEKGYTGRLIAISAGFKF